MQVQILLFAPNNFNTNKFIMPIYIIKLFALFNYLTNILCKQLTYSQFSFGAFGSDDYSIAEYAEEDLDYKVANFTITHYTQKENNIQNIEGIKK